MLSLDSDAAFDRTMLRRASLRLAGLLWLAVAVAVLASATAGLLIALLWATSSFQNDGSLADAQVLCERTIEEELGTSAKLEYIS